ncbi:hypothetical protein D9M68_901400 [compost metagenome]
MLASRPPSTVLSAAISLVKALFQFAVLSNTISTFGTSLSLGVVPTNRSMSSAWTGKQNDRADAAKIPFKNPVLIPLS